MHILMKAAILALERETTLSGGIVAIAEFYDAL